MNRTHSHGGTTFSSNVIIPAIHGQVTFYSGFKHKSIEHLYISALGRRKKPRFFPPVTEILVVNSRTRKNKWLFGSMPLTCCIRFLHNWIVEEIKFVTKVLVWSYWNVIIPELSRKERFFERFLQLRTELQSLMNYINLFIAQLLITELLA